MLQNSFFRTSKSRISTTWTTRFKQLSANTGNSVLYILSSAIETSVFFPILNNVSSRQKDHLSQYESEPEDGQFRSMMLNVLIQNFCECILQPNFANR